MRPKILEQLQTLEGICGLPFVEELVGLFLTESEARFAKLTTAITEADLVEAGKLFHKLQGSAASIDALRLRQLCALGEEACLAGDLSKATRLFDLCRTELSRLYPGFVDWKKK